MWNLLRLFPLFVGKLVPQDDKCWLLYLDFLDIVERLTAPSFNDDELFTLKCLLEEFFTKFLICYPDSHLKPKAHFLLHYPVMIKRFGPLVKSLRFEAKNGVLKEGVHLTKNRKNIPYTMAKRHQMNMYLLYKEEEILNPKIPIFTSSEELTVNGMNPSIKEAFSNSYGNIDHLNIILCAKAVTLQGCKYSENEAVILSYTNEQYEFGLVYRILHILNEVYLICRKIDCFYNHHYHAYEVSNIQTGFISTNIEQLLDYHVLGVYKIENKLLITMKYYVKEG